MIKINLKTVLTTILIIMASLSPCRAGEKTPYPPIPFSDLMALDKAERALQRNDTANAIGILEEFRDNHKVKNKPVHPVVFFTLGNYHMDLNHLEKAEICYQQAVSLAPDFSIAWMNLARISYERKHYKKAGNAFIKGYDTGSEKDPKYLYYATTAYFSSGDYTRALEIFEIILKEHKKSIKTDWLETLVHIYISLEKPLKALPHMVYLAEHSVGKKKIQWQESLLYHYMNLEMDDKALELVTRLTREHPEEPKWWKGRTHFYLKNNNFQKALVSLTIYGYLTPLTPDETKLAADLNLSLDIPDQAIKLYEKIRNLKDSQKITTRLIEACRRAGRLEEALAWTNIGIREHMESTFFQMMKGNILFEMKQYDEALKVFEKLSPDSKDGRAWLMMGYSAWNAGDLKKACLAMEKARRFKNQKKAALRALKNLKKGEL